MFNGIFLQTDFYYDKPFQVIFLRPDCKEPTYDKGIAYKNRIISSREGDVFTMQQVLARARQCGVDCDYAIVEKFGWEPLDID